MARNNNDRRKKPSEPAKMSGNGAGSRPAKARSPTPRPSTTPTRRQSGTVPRAQNPSTVEASRWVQTPFGRVLPGDSPYGGGGSGGNGPGPKNARPPTTPPTTPPTPPAPVPVSRRVSRLRVDPSARASSRAQRSGALDRAGSPKAAKNPDPKKVDRKKAKASPKVAKLSKVSSPREARSATGKPREDDLNRTCKARPDDNKPSRGGGGGGAVRRFIPWC